MPTFASIELHDVLRSRLVVVAPSSTLSSSNATTTTTTRPLESPHSLLLHAAEEWRLKKPVVDDSNNTNDNNAIVVAPHEAEAVRQQVAAALHQATVCGKRQGHILEKVQQQKRQKQKDNLASQLAADGSPNEVARGFVSVADLLQWQDSLPRRPCLQTGRPDLDALAATDDTTTAFPMYTNNGGSSIVDNAHDNDDDDVYYYYNTDIHQNNNQGIPWGTVVQLSGGPGVGKTQLALQMTAAAAVHQNVAVHYLVPAHASRTALAQRLAQLSSMNSNNDNAGSDNNDNKNGPKLSTQQQALLLSKVQFYSFRDDVQLLMILAHLEAQWNSHNDDSTTTSPPEDAPWLLVVDGWSPLTSHLQPWRWYRLVRLYHGIVVVVKSSSSSSYGSSSSWGCMHWHLDGSGRLICKNHPQPNKVGTILPCLSSETQEFHE